MSKPSRKQKNPLRQTAGPISFRTMIPHSGAWFETLLELDPVKALMTGTLVHQTARIDVCSICGDMPAPIYDALDEPYLPLRLCDDCVRIRTTGFGERLQRRPGHS